MNKYYVTFGSDPRFPYGRDEYVMVFAPNASVAGKKFQSRHPNRPGSPFLNCSEIYSEQNWREFCTRYYPGQPIEIIE